MVSNFAMMVRFLDKCSQEIKNNDKPELAIDFEGVKLSRHGALCLIQVCLRSDPTLVYVIDVHVLGSHGMFLENKHGMSFKSLMESPQFLKIWFDPRNDVDALWHQFGIQPTRVFDLQLAEVSDRRSHGKKARFVYGLNRCLRSCENIRDENGNVMPPFQYDNGFAGSIDTVAKGKFEPDHGGDYKVFQDRPLDPAILVYAAHDVRYMFALFDYYMKRIQKQDETLVAANPKHISWLNRIMLASAQRVLWCNSKFYVMPSTDAPDF